MDAQHRELDRSRHPNTPTLKTRASNMGTDRLTDKRDSDTQLFKGTQPWGQTHNYRPPWMQSSLPRSHRLGVGLAVARAAVTPHLPAAVPGHRAGSRGHHHRLLLLLPGGQELQDHGVLQEHGSPGAGHPEVAGWGWTGGWKPCQVTPGRESPAGDSSPSHTSKPW